MYSCEGEEGAIKITDFGLAKIVGEHDIHSDIVGTVGYLAPEVITKKLYTPACDVWALGVILYILLVGYPPFYGKSEMQTVSQIKKGAFVFHSQPWKNVSEEAKSLVSAMLVVNPENRITIKDILNHPWICKNSSDKHLGDAIEKLKKFNSARKLKAVTKALIAGARLSASQKLRALVEKDQANVFTIDQLKRIYNAFGEVAGSSKKIDINQFKLIFAKIGFGSLPNERMFQLFDADGDGLVTYREILVKLSVLKENRKESIRFCFDYIDSDGNGMISRDELYNMIKQSLVNDDINSNADNEAFISKFDNIMSIYDADGDGCISFEEFKNCIECNRDYTLIDLFLAPVRKL